MRWTARRRKYDAILLDVDNGPDGIVRDGNERLYTRTGIARCRDALNPGGMLAIWSAADDFKFTGRLKDAGFDVEVTSRAGAAQQQGAAPHDLVCAQALTPAAASDGLQVAMRTRPMKSILPTAAPFILRMS